MKLSATEFIAVLLIFEAITIAVAVAIARARHLTIGVAVLVAVFFNVFGLLGLAAWPTRARDDRREWR